MLVIASDLHMTDRQLGDPVTDAELVSWLENVEKRWEAVRNVEELHIIFLGDVVDLLRSTVWDEEDRLPWVGLNLGFKNFEYTYQDSAAEAAAQAICGRYGGFLKHLKALRERGASVTYVTGNHDFMLECSAKARAVVAREFGLNSADRFPTSLDLPEYDLWVEHGNRFDPYNLHLPARGAWAFGDAVVVFLVNRLPIKVSEELRVPMNHPTVRALSELDNVEPSWLLPHFIGRTVEGTLANRIEREATRDAVKKGVKELLDLRYFDGDAYRQLENHRKLVKWLVDWDLSKIATTIGQMFSSANNLKSEAYMQHREHRRSHVVFGHTHNATVYPLASYDAGRHQAFYLNTGTWRKTYLRAHGGSRSAPQFSSIRTASWVEFLRPDGAVNAKFRHLHERTH